MSASSSQTSLAYDKLFADNVESVVARKVTIISGQVLARGAVLGKITASSKYNLSLSAAADGSQTPDLILAEAVDASGGDKEGLAYEAGIFNANALTLGAAHTVASIQEGLRLKGIHLVTAQA